MSAGDCLFDTAQAALYACDLASRPVCVGKMQKMSLQIECVALAPLLVVPSYTIWYSFAPQWPTCLACLHAELGATLSIIVVTVVVASIDRPRRFRHSCSFSFGPSIDDRFAPDRPFC